jgi:hypothetical protein
MLWSERVEALEARHYLICERGLTEEEIKLLPIGYYPSAGELKRHLTSKGFSMRLEGHWLCLEGHGAIHYRIME